MNSVVIGSGFGGIAAALRLKAKNHNVTLIEKQKDLGGRARVFKRNGFTFDGGPTVITAPHLIHELFQLFNKEPKDYIDLKPLDTWYRFVFEDGSKFDYSGNEEQMKAQIKEMNPEDVIGYDKLVNFTKKIFDKGFTELSAVPFNNPSFMVKQIPALLNLKSYKSVYALVSSYIKNEKLRRLLSMHPLLVGGNPFTTTSIYGLILYLEKKWGIHYSMGGTGQIINGLEKLMKEENIEILKEVHGSSIIIGDLGGKFAKKLASLQGVWFTQPSEVTPEHILITLRGLKSEVLETFRILRDMSVTSEIRMFEEFNTDISALNLAEKRRLVMETAINLGYYEFPRKSTQRDIAKALDLKQSTISEHLQKAESSIIHAWSSKKPS